MKFENISMPPEAIEEISKNFEGIDPIITESELRELCANNLEILPLVDDLINYAERYASDVWSMHLFIENGGLDTDEGSEKFAEIDAARTILHTALVDSVGILSRALGKANLDNEWVRELTNGKDFTAHLAVHLHLC